MRGRRLNEETILVRFLSLTQLLGRLPTAAEMSRLRGVSATYFSLYWGGYRKFMACLFPNGVPTAQGVAGEKMAGATNAKTLEAINASLGEAGLRLDLAGQNLLAYAAILHVLLGRDMPHAPGGEPFLFMDDLVRVLGLSKPTLASLTRKGDIPSHRRDHQPVYRLSEVLRSEWAARRFGWDLPAVQALLGAAAGGAGAANAQLETALRVLRESGQELQALLEAVRGAAEKPVPTLDRASLERVRAAVDGALDYLALFRPVSLLPEDAYGRWGKAYTGKTWLTVPETAERLGVSVATVYKMAKNGRLPAVRVGQGTLRFAAEDLPARVEEGSLLTISEVASRLGVSISTVYNMERQGELEAVRLEPRSMRFSKEGVEQAVAAAQPTQGLLRMAEVARRLCIPAHTVYRLIQLGELTPAVSVSRRKLFREEDVEAIRPLVAGGRLNRHASRKKNCEEEAKVLRLALSGVPEEEMPQQTGMDAITVHEVLCRGEKKLDIARRRLAGQTLEKIAVPYGVSRERIRQILSQGPFGEAYSEVEEAHKARAEEELRLLRERIALAYLRVRARTFSCPEPWELPFTEAEIGRAWGSYKNMVQVLKTAMGDDIRGYGHRAASPSEMLLTFYRAQREIGSRVTKLHMMHYGIDQQLWAEHFGSWGEFLLRLGKFPVGSKGGRAKEYLMLNYFCVWDELGHEPTTTELDVHGAYTAGAYVIHWHNMDEFRREAKALPRRPALPPKLDLAGLLPEPPVNRPGPLDERFDFALEYFQLRLHLLRKPALREFSDPARLLELWEDYADFIAYAEGDGTEEALKTHTRQEIAMLFSRAHIDKEDEVSPQDLTDAGVGMSEVRELWGSWENLVWSLLPARERFPSEEALREELLREYSRVRNELGREPKLWELELHGKYPRGAYLSVWGKYRNLCWVTEREDSCVVDEEGKARRKELEATYARLTNEFGRWPTIAELTSAGIDSARLSLMWGSIEEFLRCIATEEKISPEVAARSRTHKGKKNQPYKYSEQNLIDHFHHVWATLGHQPTWKDMVAAGRPSPQTYCARFGSWTKFLASQEGLGAKKHGLSKDAG